MARIGFDARLAANVSTGIGKYVNQWLIELAQMDRAQRYTLFVAPKAAWARADVMEAVRERPDRFQVRQLDEMRWRIPTQAQMLLSDQVAMARALRQAGNATCFYPYFNPPIVSLRRAVVTITDLDLYLYPRTYSAYRRAYYNTVLKLASKAGPAFVAISEATKADATRVLGIPPGKITVLYPGVAAVYRPHDKLEAQQWVEQHFALRPRFVLYTGGLSDRKNVVRLLEAFARARAALGQELRLVITGPLASYPAVERMIQGEYADCVLGIGQVEEDALPWLYSAAELVVYPSLYEGFGMPIAEAQACGVPVVTSNCSSMKEVAGDAAILVDPHDVESIAAGIRAGLSDNGRRARLVSAGLLNAKRFDWRAGAVALDALLAAQPQA